MGNFGLYAKQMPNQTGPHWVIENNALYCEDFPKNSDTPRPDHFQVVSEILVPFCYDAIKTLGDPPGSQWLLNVFGQASATGSKEANKELSRRRALNLGEFAVAEFEAYWWSRGERPEDLPRLVPNYVWVGDKLARKEPVSKSGAPASYIEDQQAAYRSVMFLFNAGGPADHELREGGKIRSVTGVEMKPQQDHLEKALDDIKKVFGPLSSLNSAIGQLLSAVGYASLASLLSEGMQKTLGLLSDLQKHPAFVLGRYMVKVMIPTSVTYGYQMYDDYGGRRTPPLCYRFDGTEHASSVGLLDLVAVYAKLDGAISALKTLQSTLSKVQMPFDLSKAILDMMMIKKEIYAVLVRIGGLFGKEGEIWMAKFLDNYESFGSGVLIATSGWVNFLYHRSTKGLTVQKMGGLAKRFKAGGLYAAAETLEFGGPVPNNLRDFNATATLQSFSPLSNSFLQMGWAHGSLSSLGSRLVID